MICGTTQLVPLAYRSQLHGDARWQVLLNLSWMLGSPPAVLTHKFRSTAVGVNRPGLGGRQSHGQSLIVSMALGCPGDGYAPARISSAAFSAIASTVAFGLAVGSDGITEASTTLSPSTPRTRSSLSVTASGPVPIRQVPAG
jgi:hypothetical protein